MLDGVRHARKLLDHLQRQTSRLPDLAIDLEGDVAYTESYNLVFSASEPEGGRQYTYLRGSRYVDRWERREGAWRIAFRMSVTELGRYDEVQ